MSFIKNTYELVDMVTFMVVCFGDNSALLMQEGIEVWLPTTKALFGISWQTQLSKEIKEVLGLELRPDRLIRLYKVWVPSHTPTYIFHAVFEVRCNLDQKRKCKIGLGKYRNKLKWLTENEINRLAVQDMLRSPEIMDFFNLIKNKVTVNQLPDFFQCGIMFELNETILSFGSDMFDKIIAAADISQEVQKSLLRHFLALIYPAMLMSKVTFLKFMGELGWSKDDLPHLFRAADMSNRNALSYKEFLHIIAAVEPATSHGGLSAEIRCRYIFRFFDQDNDNVLSTQEFKMLILYMRKSKNEPTDAFNINKEAETHYKNMGIPVDGRPISIVDFLHAVGDLKLRGTSQIFRSPNSVKIMLEKKLSSDIRTDANVDKNVTTQKKSYVSEPIKTKSPMHFAQRRTFDVAIHTIKLQRSGTLQNVEQIWHIEGQEKKYSPTDVQALNAAVSLSTVKQASALEYKKKESTETFSQKSVVNEMMKNLKLLLTLNKPEKKAYVWGSVELSQFVIKATTICRQVKDILKEEPRMLELSSPTYVLGDIHGNYGDLLSFERLFWHLGPNLCPSNILFLGDYVDRGSFSMEVIMTLFCYKIQAPTKVYLVRGNHEIREIQKLFTFHSECINKFGEKIGVDVWNSINTAMDYMPLAATIDSKIFCCHGGIPPPWLCPVVSAINQIPVPLPNPDEQSTLAWELIWNDPVRTKQINDPMTMEMMANEGFANNQKRGTAHVFSVEALEKFLNTNGFSHMIRAHETALAGFNIQQKGRLFTVFSSSRYCGGTNEAACILADNGKLRVFRIEAN